AAGPLLSFRRGQKLCSCLRFICGAANARVPLASLGAARRESMKFKNRLGLAKLAGLTAFASASAVVLLGGAPSLANVNGAAFTTDNPGFVEPSTYEDQACTNGPAHTSPSVNCNIYNDKRDVWINGGPSAGQNNLTDGTYFFAVLDPGGQRNPNDESAGNLSSPNDA